MNYKTRIRLLWVLRLLDDRGGQLLNDSGEKSHGCIERLARPGPKETTPSDPIGACIAYLADTSGSKLVKTTVEQSNMGGVGY